MSKCITLASILTFAACTHRTPAPSPAPKTDPNCHPTRAGTCWEPLVIKTDAPPAPPPAAPITTEPKPTEPVVVDQDCRMTRSGTCWGQPKKSRVMKVQP